MPVRRVSNRGGNIVGYFPSVKLERMVAFESTIERDLLYLLDFEPHVESFVEQPLVITYWEETNQRTYTPDFQVEFTNGHTTLVECKPEALVKKDQNVRKFAAGEAWCAERGWRYEVITDQALRRGFRLENVQFLTRFARHELPLTLKYQIKAIIALCDRPLSLQEVINRVTSESPPLVRAMIFQMAFFNELVLALDEGPINLNMSIQLAPTKEKDSEHSEILAQY